jgi:hypothetical protein
MRALLLASSFLLASCGGPSDLVAHDRPVVGHLRVRGATIDLSVDSLEAHAPIDVDLHRATAQQVWAGTDDRFFDRDARR